MATGVFWSIGTYQPKTCKSKCFLEYNKILRSHLPYYEISRGSFYFKSVSKFYQRSCKLFQKYCCSDKILNFFKLQCGECKFAPWLQNIFVNFIALKCLFHSPPPPFFDKRGSTGLVVVLRCLLSCKI